MSESIGIAYMQPDGTIVLTLRASGPGLAMGDAQFKYTLSDPKYQDVIRHLGGLKPGETKAVPPWD